MASGVRSDNASSSSDLNLTPGQAQRSSPSRPGRSVSFDEQSRQQQPLPRRQNTDERIHGILQNARDRAEHMGNAHSHRPLGSGTNSPNSGPSPKIRSLERRNPDRDEHSSADENTGIFMRGGADRNYQSISATTGNSPSWEQQQQQQQQQSSAPGSAGPRARKAAGGRRSAAGSTLELPPPAGADRDSDDAGDADGAAGGASGSDWRRRARDKRRKGKEREEDAWHRGLFTHFRSIELENKGSVARDHLALERTFLAWLRTSLAFASIGIAVTQLFRLNTSFPSEEGEGNSSDVTIRRLGKPLGATFLAISIVMLFLGYQRYFNAQRWIIEGKFPASRGTIVAVAFVAFAVMMASLVVVIVVQPQEREL